MYLRKSIYFENRNFKRWLFITVHNLAFSRKRRLSRYFKIVVEEKNLYHLNIPKQPFSKTVKDAYTMNQITKIAKGFADEYKTPYLLYLSGYQYKEIATILNLPIAIVKSRVFYAHYKLQSTLTNHLL